MSGWLLYKPATTSILNLRAPCEKNLFMLSDMSRFKTESDADARRTVAGSRVERRSSNFLDELHEDETLERQRAAIRESARVASEAQARLEASREQMIAQDKARHEAEARSRFEAAAQAQKHVQAHMHTQNAEPEQQLDLLSTQMDALRDKVGKPSPMPAASHAPKPSQDGVAFRAPSISPTGAQAEKPHATQNHHATGRMEVPTTPPQPQSRAAAPHAPVPRNTTAQAGMGGSGGGGGAVSSPFNVLGFENIVGSVLRGWKTVLLFGVAGAALAGAYAMTLPNKYLSVAELLIEPRGVRVLNDTVTPSGLNSEATVAYAQSQVRIMTSMAVLQPVIDELDLVSDPEFNGTSTTGIGRIVERLFGGSGSVEPANRMAAVRKALYESLRIDRISTTFNIQVGALTQDREKSARIANAIARTYIQDESSANSRAARGANESLEGRIQVLRAQVKDAERAVQEHRQKYDLVDADGKLTLDVQIARLNEQLAMARVQTGDARTRAQAAEAANPQDALAGNLPASISSGSIQQLRIDYNRAKSQLRRLESKLGERHPKMLEAKAELASAREAIEDEVARIVRSVRNDYDRAVAREQELEGQLRALTASSASVSDAKVRLRELQATLDANREIYRTVLNRSRQTGEQENIRAQSTRLLSEAVPAESKASPDRKMLAVTGGVLGSAFGVALALLPLFWSVLKAMLRMSSRGTSATAQPRSARRETEAQDMDLYSGAQPSEQAAPVRKPSQGRAQPTPPHMPVSQPSVATTTSPPVAPSNAPHPSAYKPAPGMPGYVLYPVSEGSVPPLAASPNPHAPGAAGQPPRQQRPQGTPSTDRG